MSDIKASGTPVGLSSLTLIISTKPKMHGHSSNSVSDNQHYKRAYIRIKKENINDGSHGSNVNAESAPLVTRCDTTPIVAENKSPSLILGMQRVTDMILLPNTATLAVDTVFHMSSPSVAMEFSLKTALTSLSSSSSTPFSPAKGDADSHNVMEDSGSMGDQDRDFIMGVSEGNVD